MPLPAGAARPELPPRIIASAVPRTPPVGAPNAGGGRSHSDEFVVHMTTNSSSSELDLLVDSVQLTSVLAALVEWAEANQVDLGALEVAPPSLEDTYLELTAGAP
jgi:hypothetical protein